MRDWAHIDFRLRASLQDRFFSPFISIIAVKKELDKFYTPNIEWIEHEEHTECKPTFKIDNATAQELMDTLWECGVRPTEGNGSAGAMKATQDHLKDIQKLLFNAYGLDNERRDR